MVLFDVRNSSLHQHSGGKLALTFRATQCIKRRFWTYNQRVACSPFRSAPASLPKDGKARTSESSFHRQAFPRLRRDSRLEVRASFQMRLMSTASFLATAVRARFCPIVLMSFKPQLRKAKRL